MKMLNNLIFCLCAVALMTASTSFAHEKGEKLEVDCAHKYFTFGKVYSTIRFSFSLENLKTHLNMKPGASGGIFVSGSFSNTNGDNVNFTGSNSYSVSEDGSVSIMPREVFFLGNESTIIIAEAEVGEEAKELKSQYGFSPSPKCYVII